MILTILKYFGLCLAAASSIWGLTHELTVKTPDNKKRLTKAGIVALLFIIAGLVLSIVSEDIGRRRAARDQAAKVAAEARRTNQIIIASQPLTSLDFTLAFETSDTAFRRVMEEGQRLIDENDTSTQGGVPRVPYEAMEYEASLIPILHFLSQLGENRPYSPAASMLINDEETPTNGIIALIPLDGSPNSILSFGEIRGNAEWERNDSAGRLSAGFSAGSNQSRAAITSPGSTKEFLVNGSSKYTIQWNLDPVTLESTVDRSNATIRSGAKLPAVLNMVLLRIGNTIPFANNNFAFTSATNLWSANPGDKKKQQDTAKPEVKNVANMFLTMHVNGFTELPFRYRLYNAYTKPLYYQWGDEIEIGCTILEFRLEEE